MLCNHRQKPAVITVQPRRLDELEGTLLDPNALTGNDDAIVLNNSFEIASNYSSARTKHSSGIAKIRAHLHTSNESSKCHEDHGSFSPNSTPVRMAVNVGLSPRPSTFGPAIPVKFFQYETVDNNGACTRENAHDENSERSAPSPPNNYDKRDESLRRAYYEGEYSVNTPVAEAISTAYKVRLGSEIGRIRALEEIERTRAANREARAKPYHEKARIDAGIKIARQRVREGFGLKRMRSTGKNSIIYGGDNSSDRHLFHIKDSKR